MWKGSGPKCPGFPELHLLFQRMKLSCLTGLFCGLGITVILRKIIFTGIAMNEQELLALYEDAGALLTGHFVLSSGRHSPRYLQSAKVLMHPENAGALGGELAALVNPDGVDVIVSPALGGLIIGHEVARALSKPMIFTERKEGIMSLRRGFSLEENARVLVVEDVITTGGSVCECMGVVREYGGSPIEVLALVDRAPHAGGRFDVPHRTLLQLEVPSYDASECPLCREGTLPPVKPGSRSAA